MSQFRIVSVMSGAVNLAAAALSVVSAFLIARWLGPEALGTINALIPITAILSLLMTLGFQSAGVYYMSKGSYSAPAVFSSLYFIALVMAAVLIVVCIVSWTRLPATILSVPKWLVLAVLLTSVQQMIWLCVGDLALAMNRIDLFALVRVGWVCLYLVLLVVFVGLRGGRTEVVLEAFAGSIAVAGILLASRLYHDGLLIHDVDFRFIRAGVLFGGVIYIGELAQYVMLRADQPLVAYLAGTETAGFYAIAVRISELMWIGTNSLRTLVLARVAATPADDEWTALVSRISLSLSICVAVVIGALASAAIQLVLPRFVPAIPLVWVLLPGAPMAVHVSILSSHLIAKGKVGVTSIVRASAMTIGLVLYWALINDYAALGASVASTVIYTAEALVMVRIVAGSSRVRMKQFLIPRRSDFVLLRSLLQGAV